jgi:hypothetical protein
MLSNFNHERWVMCCASARSQRSIIEECLKWVNQRKVFGRPLSSQAVIRSKLAKMIERAESVQNWLENITYQMCKMVCTRFLLPVITHLGNINNILPSHTNSKLASSQAKLPSSSPTPLHVAKIQPGMLYKYLVVGVSRKVGWVNTSSM